MILFECRPQHEKVLLKVSGDDKEFMCIIESKMLDERFHDYVQSQVQRRSGKNILSSQLLKKSAPQKARTSQVMKRNVAKHKNYDTRLTFTSTSPMNVKKNLRKNLKRITPDKSEKSHVLFNSYADDDQSIFSASSKKITPEKSGVEASGFDELYDSSNKRIKPSENTHASPKLVEKENLSRVVNNQILHTTKSLTKFFAKPSSQTTSIEIRNTVPSTLKAPKTNASESFLKAIQEKKISLGNHNGPQGLANLGNTCYINSTLQCLFTLKSFLPSLTSNSEIASKIHRVFDTRNVQNFIPIGYNVREQVSLRFHLWLDI